MIDINRLPAPLSVEQQLIYNLLAGKDVYQVHLASEEDYYFKALLDYIQSLKPPAAAPKRTRKAVAADKEEA